MYIISILADINELCPELQSSVLHGADRPDLCLAGVVVDGVRQPMLTGQSVERCIDQTAHGQHLIPSGEVGTDDRRG